MISENATINRDFYDTERHDTSLPLNLLCYNVSKDRKNHDV